jgi:cyclopropane fatty-acyl-phospholipid synthase-like methyltransferase
MHEDKTQIAVEIFDKYASEYQAKFMDVTQYHASLDALCAHIAAPHAAVLEVACGPGNVTQYLLQKRPDLQILGTDLAPKMLALAQQNNPTASFQRLDGRAIAQLPHKYDAIVCGFFFPYLSQDEAHQFIQDAASLLRPGGVLYLSTMEDAYSNSGWRKGSQGDELFMHFHEAAFLENVLLENGFQIVDLQRVVSTSTTGTVTDLQILARK